MAVLFCGPWLAVGHSSSSEDKKEKIVGHQTESSEFYSRMTALHEIKSSPGIRDWMAHHNEPGQTYSDYISSNPIIPDEKRKVMYFIRIGEFDGPRIKAIEKTAQFVQAYYGLTVKFMDPVSLNEIPESAQRVHPQIKSQQLLAPYILEEVLIPRLPEDAFGLIGFTAQDLWPGEGWNFVFGLASIEDRVGVWSIYRNGNPSGDEQGSRLFLLRTIKVAVHEIGHMFSFLHCIYFECNYNGSNHQVEDDRRPLALCPVCLRKLKWATGLDLKARAKTLYDLTSQWGLKKEADFYQEFLNWLETAQN